jgi:protein-L-isoaspartate(D-aspartate) O-methyltransferase
MPSADMCAAQRHQMVETQLVARGLRDPAVLAAMRTVLREAFVPPELVDRAYEDGLLPIGGGKTLAPPSSVARMTAALRLSPDDRVLEIGIGTGYTAAVLSCLAKKVYAVEPFERLIPRAHHHLRRLGYTHVRIRQAHGTLGWPEHVPYQGIVVTASAPAIPEALLAQLAIGGRLVMPVGAPQQRQPLIRVTRESATTFRREDVGWVRCRPLSAAAEGANRHHSRGGPHLGPPRRGLGNVKQE